MKDFITCCVLCFVVLILVDVFWLRGKYTAAIMHNVAVNIR
jgi:hypothetical protein